MPQLARVKSAGLPPVGRGIGGAAGAVAGDGEEGKERLLAVAQRRLMRPEIGHADIGIKTKKPRTFAAALAIGCRNRALVDA